MNITIFPNSILLGTGSDIIKCEHCQLPVPDTLLTENAKRNCKEGTEWICCTKEWYPSNIITCPKCQKMKSQKDIINPNKFFKSYYTLRNNEIDELSLTFEKILYLLPP